MSDRPEPLAAMNRTDAVLGMEYNGAEGHETDTVASIIAEMRDTWTDTPPSALLDLADRIEAAAERERNAHTNDIHDALYKATGIPGNAAALREALEEISNEAQNICDYCDEQRIVSHRADKIERIVNTALAAPSRNCDRFATAEEAVAAFADHLRAWEVAHGICSEYPDHPVQVPAGAFAWLFATAEGGDHA